MRISRLDLDGLSSPRAIAARIYQLEPGLSTALPIEDLARALDIAAIDEISTDSFEAALVMDINKAAGGILIAAGRSRQRQRYSIAHELGHFLIPTHLPRPGEGFSCSLDDLHHVDGRERDRRKRVEAEANAFAAALLMPEARVRAACRSPEPNLREIVRLAREFDVSKEAMARAYVSAEREAVAVLVLRHDRIERVYRDPEIFPWIAYPKGRSVPLGSLARQRELPPGSVTNIAECEPETWFGERDASRVDTLTEQVLGQSSGFAMLLLHARLADEDDDPDADDASDPPWR